MSELPHGAEGAAALALIFSFVSWILSVLMVWLTWTHNERLSYIGLLSYVVTLAVSASIIQQGHDIAKWRTIMTAQYNFEVAHPNNGDVRIANGSIGVDIYLYYIQFYSYNTQALLITCWASELSQSIYGLTDKPKLNVVLSKVNAAGKGVALLIPAILISILHSPALVDNPNFGHLAEIPFLLGISLGGLLMLLILVKYIQSRIKMEKFNAPLPSSSNGSSSRGATSMISGKSRKRKRKSIYDKWLMTRFSIAFSLLVVFDVTTIIFAQATEANLARNIEAPGPDQSVEHARQAMFLFIPGNTPGIALFLVFGTTPTLRTFMYKTFVPRYFQRKRDEANVNAIANPAVASPRPAEMTSAAMSGTTFIKLGRVEEGGNFNGMDLEEEEDGGQRRGSHRDKEDVLRKDFGSSPLSSFKSPPLPSQSSLSLRAASPLSIIQTNLHHHRRWHSHDENHASPVPLLSSHLIQHDSGRSTKASAVVFDADAPVPASRPFTPRQYPPTPPPVPPKDPGYVPRSSLDSTASDRDAIIGPGRPTHDTRQLRFPDMSFPLGDIDEPNNVHEAIELPRNTYQPTQIRPRTATEVSTSRDWDLQRAAATALRDWQLERERERAGSDAVRLRDLERMRQREREGAASSSWLRDSGLERAASSRLRGRDREGMRDEVRRHDHDDDNGDDIDTHELAVAFYDSESPGEEELGALEESRRGQPKW